MLCRVRFKNAAEHLLMIGLKSSLQTSRPFGMGGTIGLPPVQCFFSSKPCIQSER